MRERCSAQCRYCKGKGYKPRYLRIRGRLLRLPVGVMTCPVCNGLGYTMRPDHRQTQEAALR